MTRDEAAQYVVATLRRTVWLGNPDRTASLERPLGSDGVGLDSLGIVEFLSELEGSLNIHFPDEFWSRGPRTLGDVVDFVAASRRVVPTRPASRVPAHGAARTSEATAALHEQGFWRGAAWIVTRVAERYGRMLYVRQRQLLLERDLTASLPHVPRAALPLEFRAAQPGDGPALLASGFWPPSRADYWLRLFAARFTAGTGYRSFVALHQGQIVGIDWVSGKSADTALIGLRVEMRPGSCVGENLMEHRAYRHQGIGLALLTYSLEQSRGMGYARQVTLVSAWNHRMLVTAVQLLGFRQAGELVTTWRLGHPRTAWRFDGPQGVVDGEGGTMTV